VVGVNNEEVCYISLAWSNLSNTLLEERGKKIPSFFSVLSTNLYKMLYALINLLTESRLVGLALLNG